jgi:DNA-binding protein H-NS
MFEVIRKLSKLNMEKPQYLQLLADAERLKEQAEAMRLQEIKKIAKEVANTLNLYRISLVELETAGYQFAGARSSGSESATRPAKSKRPPVLMKYENPRDPSRRWSGRGLKPKWMAEHIEAGGKMEDCLIK